MLLSIETSCDETASAVFYDNGEVASSIVLSQAKIHSYYGGIVPEVASRKHLEAIVPVVKAALKKAKVEMSDISHIAVTVEPGLIGSLLVGVSFSKGFSKASGAKVVPVNHLEGHLYAPFVSRSPPYPFLGLVVSGGHTSLHIVRELGRYELLGKTRDDAAGETFDKLGRIFDIPYPAGPAIDNLSKKGNPEAFKFPVPMKSHDGYDFSFSGLKTFFYNSFKKGDLKKYSLEDIFSSLQEAIFQSLLIKVERAVREKKIKNLVISGGVSANSRLREIFKEWCEEKGIHLYLPPAELCTDNAVMIGYVGWMRLKEGKVLSEIKVSPVSTMV